MAAKPWNVVPLVLPINGTEYEIQPIGYDDGLTLIAISTGRDSEDVKQESSEEDLFKLCVGDTWSKMQDDKVPYPAIFRACVAGVVYQQSLVLADMSNDDAVAAGEKAWDTGIDPERVAAALTAATSKLQGNQENSPTDSTNSTSSASAKKTPSRASTRPTTSRKTTPRTSSAKPAKKAAPRSRRTPSSTSTD